MEISLDSQVEFEDLPLKWCILGRNSKNNIRKEVSGLGGNPPSFGRFTEYTYNE